MNINNTLAAIVAAAAFIALPGCAVTRGQETVGARVLLMFMRYLLG